MAATAGATASADIVARCSSVRCGSVIRVAAYGAIAAVWTSRATPSAARLRMEAISAPLEAA
jgi:hypothetical protein